MLKLTTLQPVITLAKEQDGGSLESTIKLNIIIIN